MQVYGPMLQDLTVTWAFQNHLEWPKYAHLCRGPTLPLAQRPQMIYKSTVFHPLLSFLIPLPTQHTLILKSLPLSLGLDSVTSVALTTTHYTHSSAAHGSAKAAE